MAAARLNFPYSEQTTRTSFSLHDFEFVPQTSSPTPYRLSCRLRIEREVDMQYIQTRSIRNFRLSKSWRRASIHALRNLDFPTAGEAANVNYNVFKAGSSRRSAAVYTLKMHQHVQLSEDLLKFPGTSSRRRVGIRK